MASSRRALQRKGNVFDIAEAREKRNNITGSSNRSAETPKKTDSPSTQDSGAVVVVNNKQPAQSDQQSGETVAANPTTVEGKSPPSKRRDHGNRTFNHEKVEAIKAAIANGTYKINHERVAAKFIEREAPA